jgi:transposase
MGVLRAFPRCDPRRRGRWPSDHWRILDGVFWIARTGAPWRDLREEFGKWGSVYRQFRRWTLAGLWKTILLRHAMKRWIVTPTTSTMAAKPTMH